MLSYLISNHRRSSRDQSFTLTLIFLPNFKHFGKTRQRALANTPSIPPSLSLCILSSLPTIPLFFPSSHSPLRLFIASKLASKQRKRKREHGEKEGKGQKEGWRGRGSFASTQLPFKRTILFLFFFFPLLLSLAPPYKDNCKGPIQRLSFPLLCIPTDSSLVH